MEIFEAIEKRHAVKHYAPSVGIPKEEFNRLMSTIILSPASNNIQNWRFVLVKDRNLRAQMKEAGWGQRQVADAAELLILCAYLNAWGDRPERYRANANEDTRSILLSMLESFYAGKDPIQRDEAMRSCGLAAQTLMLAAKAKGNRKEVGRAVLDVLP